MEINLLENFADFGNSIERALGGFFALVVRSDDPEDKNYTNLAKVFSDEISPSDYFNLGANISDFADTNESDPKLKSKITNLLKPYVVKVRDAVSHDEELKNSQTVSSILDYLEQDADESSQKNSSSNYVTHNTNMDTYKEGYEFYTKVDKSNVDRLIDWFEHHNTNFIMESDGAFYIEYVDDSTTELLNNFVKDLKENEMKKEPRNLTAVGALQRSESGIHESKQQKKDLRKDQEDRTNLSESFNVGDTVTVDGSESVVKVAKGPHNTIGITRNGKLEMVEKSKVSRVDETVLGMTSLPTIGRLRALAGLKKVNEDEGLPVLGDEPLEDDSMGSEMPNLGGVEAGLDDMGADASDMDSIDDPLEDDFEDDIGDSMDDLGNTADIAPVVGAAPVADVPPAPAMDVPAPAAPASAVTPMGTPVATAPAAPMPMNSPAYGSIMSNLDGIQSKIMDVKVSEYKEIVRRLHDVLNTVRNQGYEYLQEARKAKAKAEAEAEKKAKTVKESKSLDYFAEFKKFQKK